VKDNLPILGTTFRAQDIANTQDICAWNPDMYGVDMTKPGAQAYYDSVFKLLASWEVDFVKVDDLSRPYREHIAEIEAIRKAIDHSGRPMVLSTSPGETPLEFADHVYQHANMWRISDDFWDDWQLLKNQFTRCAKWAPYVGPGHFPDADMIPFGRVRAWEPKDKGGWTRFTHDEQQTLISLWAIAQSPLIFGGNMPENDQQTLSLLTNPDVIRINQAGSKPRELRRDGDSVVWVSDGPNAERNVALFNLSNGPATVALSLKDAGIDGPARAKDCWVPAKSATVTDELRRDLPPHGSVLFVVTQAKAN
jgi:hypothetical protein